MDTNRRGVARELGGATAPCFETMARLLTAAATSDPPPRMLTFDSAVCIRTRGTATVCEAADRSPADKSSVASELFCSFCLTAAFFALDAWASGVATFRSAVRVVDPPPPSVALKSRSPCNNDRNPANFCTEYVLRSAAPRGSDLSCFGLGWAMPIIATFTLQVDCTGWAKLAGLCDQRLTVRQQRHKFGTTPVLALFRPVAASPSIHIA